MKHILLTIALFVSQLSLWAAEQTVTLVVSGQGKTRNEAQQNALRSAIEQAFGAFISSKTEILNDELVRDEVISVSNGNIHEFEIVSSTEIPNGGGFAMTLKATVSVTKLTAFAEQKGALVEFKGALFSENIRLKEMYEKNEAITVSNICQSAVQMFAKSFDYALTVSEPTKATTAADKYDLLMTVDVNLNTNYVSAVDYFINSVSALSCNKDVISEYEKLKKPIYYVYLTDAKGSLKSILLRDGRSAELIRNIGNSIQMLTHCFVVKSGSFELDTKDNTIDVVNGYKMFEQQIKTWPSGRWSLFEDYACFKKDDKRAFIIPTKSQSLSVVGAGVSQNNLGVYFTRRCGHYRLSQEGVEAGYDYLRQGSYFPIRSAYGNDSSRASDQQTPRTLLLSFFNPLDGHVTQHKTVFRATLAELEKITEITVSPKAIK